MIDTEVKKEKVIDCEENGEMEKIKERFEALKQFTKNVNDGAQDFFAKD